ncbi:hypothetical protein GCM10022222_85570 [Amycolatopsis ultiminotia]|uniref:Uncharacterized protein n=1 Tax=Amycolatopsis ultiminotia TaxID=543629 RepID=A0ABP6YP79_9PSEU
MELPAAGETAARVRGGALAASAVATCGGRVDGDKVTWPPPGPFEPDWPRGGRPHGDPPNSPRTKDGITLAMAAAAFLVIARDAAKKGIHTRPDTAHVQQLLNHVTTPIRHTTQHAMHRSRWQRTSQARARASHYHHLVSFL